MKKLNLIYAILITTGLFILTGCEKDKDDPEDGPMTIVELAVENGFTVLAAALTEAGLIDDLQATGDWGRGWY